jgi:hypothetical protein
MSALLRQQMLMMAQAATGIYFNPARIGPDVTLANDNKTATIGGANDVAEGALGKTSGKYYFEVVIDGLSDTFPIAVVGVSDGAQETNVGVGGDAHGVGVSAGYYSGGQYFQGGGASGSPSAYTTGDVIGVAFDVDAGLIWWSKNGVWDGDPAAGTGSPFAADVWAAVYPAVSGNGSTTTLRVLASEFRDAPPAGFSALKVVPAITLTATFPTSLHVGDSGTFDITARLLDGATGSLTITGSSLPDGMSVGSTTDNGDDTFTATVSYDLTTEQDVTTTFSATGGSVAATPLVHEFDVQAEASGGPVLVQYTTYSSGSTNKANLVLPAAPTAGNLLLLEVRAKFNASAATITGWTLLSNTGPTSQPSHLYWRISDGTEQSGNYASGSGSNGVGGALMEWSGVTTAADHYGSTLTAPVSGGTATTDTPPDPNAIPVIFFNQRGGQDTTTRVTGVESGWTLAPDNPGLINYAYDPSIVYNLTAPGAATSVDFTLGATTDNYYQYDVVWIY